MREVRDNKLQLDIDIFYQYRDDIDRIFKGIINSIHRILPNQKILDWFHGPKEFPDGFTINHNYTVEDANQSINNIYSYIDFTINTQLIGMP